MFRWSAVTVDNERVDGWICDHDVLMTYPTGEMYITPEGKCGLLTQLKYHGEVDTRIPLPDRIPDNHLKLKPLEYVSVQLRSLMSNPNIYCLSFCVT